LQRHQEKESEALLYRICDGDPKFFERQPFQHPAMANGNCGLLGICPECDDVGIMLALEAFKPAVSTGKANVRDAIEATKVYIGTGSKVTISATEHMGLDLSAFRMLEIKNGDWRLLN
jgi:hypothetical protein